MVESIDRETLRTWVEQRAEFALLDTLPSETFARHHVPGAINMPSDHIRDGAKAPRYRTVVVYCGSAECKRSEQSAARPEALGYRDVREYVDGRRD